MATTKRDSAGMDPRDTPSADMIEEYTTYLRMLGRAERTIGDWRLLLHRADRELPQGLDAAEGPELQRWIAGPAQRSPSTRASYHAALVMFYRWATRDRDRWLELDPMQDVDPPMRAPQQQPNPCTDEELTYILTHATEQIRTWALFAAYAGLRCCEISALDREHITAQNLRVHGKGYKPRTVPTYPVIWALAQQLPPGPVATLRNGRRAGPGTVSGRARYHLQRKLNLPGMRMHRLRHWYGTRTLEVVGDVRVVQELLGHASVATTQVYTQVAEGRRTDAVRGLPDVTSVESDAGPDPVAVEP